MPTASPSFQIRPLDDEADFTACLDLQRATWGDDFRELVPAALLQITQKVGGVAAGAFDAAGQLIGFVYGITGLRDGELAHWSHMLAVREDLRGHGIGQALKLYQRDFLSQLGVTHAFWTFDPLVARNGHLNLMRLGATVTEYVANMYGDTSMNKTDSVIGTDRFVVRWNLAEPSVHERTPMPDWQDTPIVTAAASTDEIPSGTPTLAEVPCVRVEVPTDVQALKRRVPRAAAAWRRTTRRAFQHYLAGGYTVRGLIRDWADQRCFYVVARD